MSEFDVVTGLGYGIITFAMVIGVGLIIMTKFGGAVSDCPTGYVWNTNGSTTFTDDACCLTGGTDCSSAGNYTDASQGTQSAVYMTTQIGEDGLASWTPAIVALVVGMLFLGMFLTKGKRV